MVNTDRSWLSWATLKTTNHQSRTSSKTLKSVCSLREAKSRVLTINPNQRQTRDPRLPCSLQSRSLNRTKECWCSESTRTWALRSSKSSSFPRRLSSLARPVRPRSFKCQISLTPSRRVSTLQDFRGHLTTDLRRSSSQATARLTQLWKRRKARQLWLLGRVRQSWKESQ